jgi:ribosomal protein S18 acetylase RimI-like enzyme
MSAIAPLGSDRVDVRVLEALDARAAAAVLARGFAEEPGNAVLLPDPDARHAFMQAATYATIHTLLPYGTAHGALVGDRLGAVALWHPPGAPHTPIGVGLGTLVGLAARPVTMARAMPHALATMLRQARAGRALAAARRTAVAQASAGATWHLAFLATDPDCRGRGLARALLDRQLRRWEVDGAAAWL